MDLQLGRYRINSHDDPHSVQWLKHLRKIDRQERRILFGQAAHKGHVDFSPKEGVNLKLRYNPNDKSFTLHHE
ncbi:MAG TPA: hypothetical protein VJK50_03060 [Patescibacteria group bacterium]|nr:hypothetical protein [Patescibacteria group bacterium]